MRSMAGENVVIMQGQTTSDMTRIISLNDTSLMLWNELQDRDFTAEDIADIIIDEYGIDGDIALRDARAWVEKLQKCNLIEN